MAIRWFHVKTLLSNIFYRMTSDCCNGTLTVNNILYGDITFTLNVNRTFFFLLKTVKCYQLTYCTLLKHQAKHQKVFIIVLKEQKHQVWAPLFSTSTSNQQDKWLLTCLNSAWWYHQVTVKKSVLSSHFVLRRSQVGHTPSNSHAISTGLFARGHLM